MADTEFDAAIIKATQQALGKYIKKPPLTDKLLKKPPFRFLMDVFNAFIKQTGCFEGLYTAEEQLFENIRDRDDKTRYLQKMIDAIKLTTKRELKVRTSKIVAGHEPEHTNELLQLMASVAAQRLDWESAVEQLQSGSTGVAKPKERKNSDNKTKELKVSSKEEVTKSKRSTEKRISPQEQKLRKATEQATRGTPADREKRKEKLARPSKSEKADKLGSRQSSKKTPSPVKVSTSKAKQQISTESESKSATPVQEAKPEPVKQANPEPVKQASPKASQEVDKTLAAAAAQMSVEPIKVKELEQSVPAAEPESRKSSAQHHSSASSAKSRRSSASQRAQREELESATEATPPASDSNNNSSSHVKEVKREQTFTREVSKDSTGSAQRPRTSLRPPSARPASARPGAPRRRDRNVEIVLQPNDQVKMSGINVKLETFGDFDDDGENLVIIEDAHAHDIASADAAQGAVAADMQDLDAAQQGHLVQQILETQKELVQQSVDQAAAKEEQLNMGARQSSARQVDGLREVIQNLTKSVNPFGKLMDFIPEDIDAMQLELSLWRNTYAQASIELKHERQLTESATAPMKQQLLQIEDDIREYLELNDASRHKILQNNERILKMLMEQ